LTSAELIGRRDQALAASPDLTWLAGLLIIAAIIFNALLCFVNTHVAPISNAYVVGSEAVIITVTILACYRFIDPKYALIITTIIVYTAVLAFLRALTSPDEGMNLKVARDSYRAYESGDRSLVEAALTDDFTFYSPADVGIDRDTYFERCWPNAERVESFEFKRLVEVGDEVFVTYESTKTDGGRFRNTEVLTFEGDKICCAEVYFGWDLE